MQRSTETSSTVLMATINKTVYLDLQHLHCSSLSLLFPTLQNICIPKYKNGQVICGSVAKQLLQKAPQIEFVHSMVISC